MQVEVRNSIAYKELNELYKKADDDANILNTELEDEKAKSKRLETRLADTEKVKEELQKKISELEKNVKTSSGMYLVDVLNWFMNWHLVRKL